MAKFITGEELNSAIYDIIWEAKETLLIVSPFIKLDDYFKRLFDKHVHNPKIHILIVFGKNEKERNKSFNKNDFDYFKKFLRISIIYIPNLHAKYCGNESKGVISSINLYDFSFKNNIEFGVYSENNILNKFTSSPDHDAWYTSMDLAFENEAVFVKRPVYEKKLLSSILGNNYVKSEVLHDVTEKFFSFRNPNKEIKTLQDFPDEIFLGSETSKRPLREDIELISYTKDKKIRPTGYCIRTGVEIPFNPRRPLSSKAYDSWASFGNKDYAENFCHKTGRRSNGRTSFRNPILFD
ncbi:MAG: phospholipase D family protein [Bacteroidales bacterium]|nr:phospholipase D family protein [Bacteroidales bacterium]